MFALSRVLREPMLSRATRLQLGNVKTERGLASTAAGSHEKWGFVHGTYMYPILHSQLVFTFPVTLSILVGAYYYYRDLCIVSEHITYEDVHERCLMPIPGWARLRDARMIGPFGLQTYRDQTPLDWLPFQIKLGHVKQASY